MKRGVEDWNAAAWSNFVEEKRHENSAAWSNFVRAYAADDTKEKRDEGWNAAAWSNFFKVYAGEKEKV